MSGGEDQPVSGPQPETGRQLVLNRRGYLGAIGGLAVATAGCLHGDGGREANAWNTVRGDVARSGITTEEAGPGESLSLAWERTDSEFIREIEGGEFAFEPGGLFLEPVLYDEYCLFTFRYKAFPDDADGDILDRAYVIGVSQEDGSLAWTQKLLEGQKANEFRPIPPEVTNGSVYIRGSPTQDESYVDVLDAESGERTNRIELERPLENDLIHDGSLYGVQQGRYSAIDLADGSPEWQMDVETTVGTPALMALSADTLVYTGRNYLAARDVETGEVQWETEELQGGPVMLGDGVGYLAATQGTFQQSLVAFDLADGTVQWEFSPEGYPGPNGQSAHRVPWPPVVVDDLVLTTGTSGLKESGQQLSWNLYALDPADGTPEWTVNLGTLESGPVVAGETVYVGNKAITKNGDELDSIDAEHRISGYPAIGNGRLYSRGPHDSEHQRLVALE